MDKISKPEFFHVKYTLQGKRLKPVVQYCLSNDKFSLLIGLLKLENDVGSNTPDKDSYFLFQINRDNHELSAIPIDMLCDILAILKRNKTSSEIDDMLGSIELDILPKDIDKKLIQLSSSLWCSVIDEKLVPMVYSIQIRVNGIDYPVDTICLYCFDDISFHVQLMMSVDDMAELAKWHMIAGFFLIVDGVIAGDFYMDHPEHVEDKLKLLGVFKPYHSLSLAQVKRIDAKSTPPEDLIEFLISMDNSGWKVNKTQEIFKWFTVTVPIQNMDIESDFGFAAIRFLRASHDDIHKIVEHRQEILSIYHTFAQVQVNETSIYRAVVKGRVMIADAINYIANYVRDDSPCINHGTIEDTLAVRSLLSYEFRPDLSEWVHIISRLPQEEIFANLKTDFAPKKILLRDFEIDGLYFSSTFEMSVLNSYTQKDEKMVSLLGALKWINRSWNAIDYEDKLIYIMIALEFAVSKETGGRIIEKVKARAIAAELEKVLSQSFKDIPEDTAQKLKNSFIESCSHIPLMRKLSNVINRLNIPVSNADYELVKRARDERNLLVHGKDCDNLTKDELRLLCEIISTVVFYMIKEDQE